MNTKHTNKYVCNLLQKNRKRPGKKSEVKVTKTILTEKLFGATFWGKERHKALKLQDFSAY